MPQPQTIKIDEVEHVREDSIPQRVKVESVEDFKASQIGSKVIVRCKDAGVYCGTLVSFEGREAVLTNSRRLCYWSIKGHTLNAVFLLFVIEEKEQQKLTATPEQVKRLDVEIKQARRLLQQEKSDEQQGSEA